MSEKIIKVLIKGKKANAGPPLGPSLAPMGINIGQVVSEINEKTTDFAGMTIPVKVVVDTSTKKFKIEVGTPSTSALIKQAIGAKKGSGKATEDKIGDITIDQIIKVGLAKKDVMHAKTPQKMVKEAMGSCIPMGVLIEGKDPKEMQKEVDKGIYDAKILGKEPLIELTKEEISKRNKPYQDAMAAKAKTVADTGAGKKK